MLFLKIFFSIALNFFPLFLNASHSVADNNISVNSPEHKKSHNTEEPGWGAYVYTGTKCSIVFLELFLPEGSHTYYKEPGDIGLGTSIEVRGKYIASQEIYWPEYSVSTISLDEDIIKSNVYSGHVVLPVRLGIKNNKKFPIDVLWSYVVCNGVCTPYERKIKLIIDHNKKIDYHTNDLHRKYWNGKNCS